MLYRVMVRVHVEADTLDEAIVAARKSVIDATQRGTQNQSARITRCEVKKASEA